MRACADLVSMLILAVLLAWSFEARAIGGHREEQDICAGQECPVNGNTADNAGSAMLQVQKHQARKTWISRDPIHEPTPEIGTHMSLARDGNRPDLNDTSAPVGDEFSARAAIRLEMARRALMVEDEDEDFEEYTQMEQPVDETFDPDMISGANAELSEEGYSAIATICCPLEMSQFAERLINQLGFVVCDEGSLQGMVAWYYCKNQTRTFVEMVEESIAAAQAQGECAWVGTESSCPEMSANCPHFPDATAHRRRSCRYRKMVNTTTTTASPSEPTTTNGPFYCSPGTATALDFGRSNVTLNNLGGAGPGEGVEKLTYQGIGTYQGSSIDLVVKAGGVYVPDDATQNGIEANRGQVNVKSSTAAELTFRFQYTATKKTVQLPEFYFTFLDIDDSDSRHQERIYVTGFQHDLEEEVKDFETELLPDGRTLYKSLQVGGTWDEPTDPLKLGVIADPSDPSRTVDQRKRAVMLVFRDTSQFSVTLEVVERESTGSASGGRNFMFAGESSLLDLCPTQ